MLSFDYLLKLEDFVEDNISQIEYDMHNIFTYLKNRNKENDQVDSESNFSNAKKNYCDRFRKKKKKSVHIKKGPILKMDNAIIGKKKREIKRKTKNEYIKNFAKKKTRTEKMKETEENHSENLISIERYIQDSNDYNPIEVKSNKKKECRHSIKLLREINVKDKNCVLSLAQSPDMNYILAGLDTGALCIYDFSAVSDNKQNKETTHFEKYMKIHDGAITSIQFSKQKCKTFFTVGIDKKIKLWKLKRIVDTLNIDENNNISRNINIETNNCNNNCNDNNCNDNKNYKLNNNSVSLHLLCEIEFHYHITSCIFHSTIQGILIIGLINGIAKLVRLGKISEEKENIALQEIEFSKEMTREKERGGANDFHMFPCPSNYLMCSNMSSIVPQLSKKAVGIPSSRFLDPSNVCTVYKGNVSNINKSNMYGAFSNGHHEIVLSTLLKSNNSLLYNRKRKESNGTVIGIDNTINKNFFETNFLENINKLQKKKKKFTF